MLKNPMYDTMFRLTANDFQDIALERIGRKLTPSELESVKTLFENAIDWHEYAQCAIDQAVTP